MKTLTLTIICSTSDSRLAQPKVIREDGKPARVEEGASARDINEEHERQCGAACGLADQFVTGLKREGLTVQTAQLVGEPRPGSHGRAEKVDFLAPVETPENESVPESPTAAVEAFAPVLVPESAPQAPEAPSEPATESAPTI